MKAIPPLELEKLLDGNEPVEILDLRPRQDFDECHIPGAHCLPAAAVSPEKVVSCRELLATEPLYLVSESGAEAQQSASELEQHGFDNLIVVKGGMDAWLKEHLPVERRGDGETWPGEFGGMIQQRIAATVCDLLL